MTLVLLQDLRDSFYAYGEIRSISVVAKQGCAFVQYTRRASAEVAAEKTFNKLVRNEMPKHDIFQKLSLEIIMN